MAYDFNTTFGGMYPQYVAYPGTGYGQQMQQMRPQQAGGQQSSALIWVQGEAGAKAFIVGINNTVLLMDSEKDTFYIKSCDASGMPSMRIFDYIERTSAPKSAPAANPAAEYITRSEAERMIQSYFSAANNDKKGADD